MRASAYVSDRRPLRDYDDGASLLRVLSSPVRLAVLDELSRGERCVHELVDAVLLPQAQQFFARAQNSSRLVLGCQPNQWS